MISLLFAQIQLTSLFYLAPASTAQARIWLDERIRFHPDKPLIAIYNMPFLFRLHPHQTLSITQLHHALQLIVIKHLALRTSLIFDKHNNQLIQRVHSLNNEQIFTFTQTGFDTDEQLTHIMHEEKSNAHLFDLGQGLVFRCHLLRHKETFNNDRLNDQDAIIFNFHHAQFDFPSMDIFLHDLHRAYTTGQLTADDHTTLRYLDCKCAHFSHVFFHRTFFLFRGCVQMP